MKKCLSGIFSRCNIRFAIKLSPRIQYLQYTRTMKINNNIYYVQCTYSYPYYNIFIFTPPEVIIYIIYNLKYRNVVLKEYV